MVAIDTNVLVRFIARDDAAQFEIASDVMAGTRVVIPSTVLLETEWVLRRAFRYAPEAVATAFAALLALPNVVVSHEERLLGALEHFRLGMDFADALHLAGAVEADAFVTFDKAMAHVATRAETTPPVRLL